MTSKISKVSFSVLFAVKPTVIHTDMFVNSIGPVNAINMVSEVGLILHKCCTQASGRCGDMQQTAVPS